MNAFFRIIHFLPATRLLLILALACQSGISPLAGQTTGDLVQTMTQARADLASENSDIRRGGAMLLGKYANYPGVMDTLLVVLDDPSAPVRRAAVVSLVRNASVLTPAQAANLLGALKDSDPEVRLGVAAWAPQLVMIATRLNLINPNMPLTTQGQPEIEEALLAALEDPDANVRLKAIEALRYLRWPFPEEPLVRLFADENPEVRLLSYQILANLLSPHDYVSAVMANLPEPSEKARLALAEAVVTRPAAESEPLYAILSEDPSPDIRLLALAGRFLTSREGSLPGPLKDALIEGTLDQRLVMQILNAVRGRQPEDMLAIAEILLESRSPFIRGQALGLWLRSLIEPPPDNRLRELLQDPAPEVRQQVLRYLASRSPPLDATFIQSLTELPHMDVRRRALDLARFLPRDQQSQLALRLLLDTEPEIRSAALERIARMKAANWPRLFKASLRDPDERVQQAAAIQLISNLGPDGAAIARAYAEANPDQAISRLIKQRLSAPTPPATTP